MELVSMRLAALKEEILREIINSRDPIGGFYGTGLVIITHNENFSFYILCVNLHG
jgi:hypothetical protein